MKKITLAFSVFAVWFALAGSYYVCVIKGLCNNTEDDITLPNSSQHTESVLNESIENNTDYQVNNFSEEEVDLEIVDTLYSYPLEIYSQGELITNYERNFIIKENDTVVTIPEELVSFNEIIKSSIVESEEVVVSIYSYYHAEEDSTIALGRANFIKEKLKDVAIAENNVRVELQQIIIEFDKEHKFEGGLEISVELRDEELFADDDYTDEENEDSNYEEGYYIDEFVETEKESNNSASYDDPEEFEKAVEVDEEVKNETTTIVSKPKQVKVVNRKVKTKKSLPILKDVNKQTAVKPVKQIEKKPVVVAKPNSVLINNKVDVNQKSDQLVTNRLNIEQKKEKVIKSAVKTSEKIIPKAKKVSEKKKPKIVFIKTETISNKAFKGAKLKDVASVKSFIADYKDGQKIYLDGFSNEKSSSFDNYQDGLGLANTVKSYLKKQGISSSNIVINAKKLSQGNTINKGVILQLK